MEIAEWKQIDKCIIDVVRSSESTPPKGYMLRFASVDGKETRIIFTPKELAVFNSDIENALEWMPK